MNTEPVFKAFPDTEVIIDESTGAADPRYVVIDPAHARLEHAENVNIAETGSLRRAASVPFQFTLSKADGAQRFEAGDMLIYNGGDQSITPMAKAEFYKTYRLSGDVEEIAVKHAAKIAARKPLVCEVQFKDEHVKRYKDVVATLKAQVPAEAAATRA